MVRKSAIEASPSAGRKPSQSLLSTLPADSLSLHLKHQNHMSSKSPVRGSAIREMAWFFGINPQSGLWKSASSEPKCGLQSNQSGSTTSKTRVLPYGGSWESIFRDLSPSLLLFSTPLGGSINRDPVNGHFRNLNRRYLPYIRPIQGLCKGISP